MGSPWSTRMLLAVLAGSIGLVQPSGMVAQTRNRHGRGSRPPAVVVTPPRDRTGVVVGPKEYHYARGVFYRVGPKGYVAIRGPVGARIKTLPPGYVSLTIGGAPFFFYYGTYYQFDPVASNYVVVAPPPAAPTVPGLDQVQLISGETINGTYLGGTDSRVQMDVKGQMRQIPIEQNVSIVFAPSGE